MLQVVYAQRTEDLLGRLAHDVREARRESSPLDPVALVVPNRNVETYVRFGLARSLGIAANVQVHLLRRFVAGLVEGASTDVRLVDAVRLESLLLSVLLDEQRLASDPSLSPVLRYLHVDDSARGRELRRVQLAAQLAHLFEEYGYARPDMLQAWPERPVLQGTPYADTEAWQRRLWLTVLGPDGLAQQRAQEAGQRWLTAAGLLGELPKLSLKLPPRVFLFGVSYVARFFQQVFAQLSAQTDLRIYTLNPCSEYWEDIDTGRAGVMRTRIPRFGLEALELEDPYGLETGNDTPLLRLWGRPGRENIRLLNELVEYDPTPAFHDDPPRDGHLLGALQWDVLKREELPSHPPDAERFASDASVQFHSCPSIRREAEFVADEIWRLVKEDEPLAKAEGRTPLRFNDIAVIVSPREREAYFTHLTAAFREAHDLPHNVVDVPFAQSSRVAEAARLLLDLPLGRFGRPELLRLVTHPAVTARFGEASADEWGAWCDALGIVHGADREDHEGTYIQADVLNWDQGVRRLALGAFLSGERSGCDEALPLGTDSYRPLETAGSAHESAARLGLLVRSLVADARFARRSRLTTTDWARFLRAWVESCLGDADGEDERDLRTCLSAVQSIAGYDLGDEPVSYDVAHALATRALDGISGGRGHHLADGVVVATGQPMRAIPFRVIFMVGLGEGQFPAPDRRNHLDLRAARRRAGDVSQREQDKYLFLETLLCARERLYLSHVGRDAQTGEALQPSSLVVELKHVLEQGYVGEEGLERLDHRHTLRRWEEPDALHSALPEVRREAAVRELRKHLEQSLPSGRLPTLEELREALPEDTRGALLQRLSACPPPPPEGRVARRIRLNIAALRQFLECPIQGFARQRLGLSDDEDGDLLATTDEPFETEYLPALLMLQQSFLGTLQNGESGEAAQKSRYEAQAARLLAAARVPVGLFSDLERQKHLSELLAWDEGFHTSVAEAGAAEVRALRFGQAEEHVDAQVHEPVLLDVPVRDEIVRVELVGRTQPIIAGPRAGSLLLERRKVDKADAELVRRRRSALKAFLDQVLLAASGVAADRPHASFLLLSASAEASDFEAFKPVSQDEARTYLTTLVSDLLNETRAYRLPIEAVLESHASESNLLSSIERAYTAPLVTPRSIYGPVPHPESYPLPDADFARAAVERRFGLFFARLTTEAA